MIHLGMSGRLRVVPADTSHVKHDHVDFVLDSGKVLRFHDPRRFGSILWVGEDAANSKLLKNLGPEPFDETLTAVALYRVSRGRKTSIKQFIMDGRTLGLLHGIPYSIKDLQMTRGVRTMRGSKIFEHSVPQEENPLQTRLANAGGVFLGKTTTPEFGWKGVTDSPVTGLTRNPWNLDRTPGGSSGGASAQVAAGLGPLAQGGDGGGSIRIPASFSGIFGLKPTHGTVPYYPMPHNDHFSHLGPMTRTVTDAALMLEAMAGYHPADRFSQPGAAINYRHTLDDGIEGLKICYSHW